MANLLWEEDTKKKKEHVGGGGGGGGGKFAVVDSRPAPMTSAERKVVAKERRAKARAEADAEELERLADRGIDVQEMKIQKERQQRATAKWGTGPVGCAVVDPEVEKAQKKALDAQIRRNDKQAAAKKRGGGARAEVILPSGPAGEPVSVAPKNSTAAPVAVVAKPGGWGAPCRQQQHTDPFSALGGAATMEEKFTVASKIVSQQRKTQQKRQVAKQPTQPTPKPASPTSGLAVLDRHTLTAASAEPTAADGSAPAALRLVFVAGGKPLGVTAVDVATGIAKGPLAAVHQHMRRGNWSVDGGFFISVAGKHFSDGRCIDEPWMATSYIKATAALLAMAAPVVSRSAGQPLPAGEAAALTRTAFPFMLKGSRAAAAQRSGDAPEAEVRLTIPAAHPTALDMQHVGGTPAQVTKARVAIVPFAQALLSEARLMLAAASALGDASTEDGATRVPSCLPAVGPLESAIESLAAAIDDYQPALDAWDKAEV